MKKVSLTPMVHTQTFGKETKPTVYYVTGYGSTIGHFSLHIRLLTWSGYRVVAFDHAPSLLDSGDPQQLKAACDAISEYIELDMKTHATAGLYGISLGSFVALYCGVINKIDRIMINAGLDSFARIVTEQPRLGYIRKAFQQHGFGTKELYKAWQEYDLVLKPTLYTGKKLLVMDSMADDLVVYNAVVKNQHDFIAAGAQLELLTHKKLSHGQVIVRNCFRIIKTARFYKK